jgi:GntR family transcriptional repressor for pyruvate dehydrogenase complex
MPDEITRRLVQLILDEGLKPGDKLPSERQLIARLGVGRSSLREAVKSLRAAGVIEVAGGEGMFVGRGEPPLLVISHLSWRLLMSERTTREVIEARRVVEVELAGFAAERATDADLDILRERLARVRAVRHDGDAYLMADLEFHRAVASAGHNLLLRHIFESLHEIVVAWLATVITEVEGGRPQWLPEHEAVFEAISARDVSQARAAMAAHLEAAGARLLRVVPAADAETNLNGEE